MVNLAAAANGTVSANRDYVPTDANNKTVTVTATPAEGYQLKSLSYSNGNDDTPITESEGVYSFTMPAANVTIKAEFEEAHVHTLEEVPAKAATCTEPGVKTAYWVCTGDAGCGKCFTDNTGATEITAENLANDYIAAATGHNFTGAYVSHDDGTHSYLCANDDCTAMGIMDAANENTPVVYEAGVGGFEDCADESVKDHKCDVCGYVMSQCVDNEGDDHLCDVCGKKLSECEDDGSGHCKVCGKDMGVPATPTKPACNPVATLAKAVAKTVSVVKAVSAAKTAVVVKTVVKTVTKVVSNILKLF